MERDNILGGVLCWGMENETNLILTTLDRANACTMRACDDFAHTVFRARSLARRIQFRDAAAANTITFEGCVIGVSERGAE